MTFAEDVSIGDILLCLKSATSIAAVGVVVGDYIFDSSEEDLWRGYFHKRAVKWLATGLDVDISELNGGSALTQKAIYELRRISPADALSLAGELKSGEGDVLPHVLIIDEINRANVSKVFGELITLIEPSKRAGATEALEVILPYSKKPFSVPGNLYLIGTMNTADRSLATLDIALRRRFDFLEMSPDPETLSGILLQSIDISKLLRVMNQRIEVLLDRDHALGHAYLLPLKSDPSLARLACIFRKQILPLLQEYFFEDWERIRWVLNDHRKQKDEHKFIVPPQYRIGELIGEGAGIPTEARQWRINYSALEHPESFLGIIGL
jgi:5-methylcytosine-specific restriction protein B